MTRHLRIFKVFQFYIIVYRLTNDLVCFCWNKRWNTLPHWSIWGFISAVAATQNLLKGYTWFPPHVWRRAEAAFENHLLHKWTSKPAGSLKRKKREQQGWHYTFKATEERPPTHVTSALTFKSSSRFNSTLWWTFMVQKHESGCNCLLPLFKAKHLMQSAPI